jgi:DNA-binding Xre family transcriptional regulator
MATSRTKYKKLLAERDISQVSVAKATGISQCALSLIANGQQNMQMRTLKKLVIFHRVDPSEILDWEKWIVDADAKKANNKQTSKK